MRIVGYGVCGKEADRYLKETLDEFKRLCDDTVICLNNATQKEKDMIDSYGFYWYEDNREWGTSQHLIKQQLLDTYVSELKPDWCIALDMDEVFANLDRGRIEKICMQADAFYVYIVNLWDEGYNRDWSFWNVRLWKWGEDTKIKGVPLHCGLAPEWTYKYGNEGPIVLRHYGLKKKEDRQKKVERYEKYDPHAVYKDRSFYEALKQNISFPYSEEAVVKEVEAHAKKYTPAKKKTMFIPDPKRFVIVRRLSDGQEMDIPKKDLQETLQRGFVFVRDASVELSKPKEMKLEEYACQCGFIAKSPFGLKVHGKVHNTQ